MTCDLTDMEIQILYILYRNKNFKIDADITVRNSKKSFGRNSIRTSMKLPQT